MITVEPPSLMTAEQFLMLPDTGTERELVRGLIEEREVTLRGRRHTRVGTKVARLLDTWLSQQPEPRGEVLTGEAAFRLASGPDTLVGIDVAYMSAAMATANPDDAFIIDGPPVLAVEILSPSDTQASITGKIQTYLDAGVQLIWVCEPVFRTVIVYRPGAEPAMFNVAQQLDGGSDLPGFRADVAEVYSIRKA